jgi:hypothetical protein
MSNFKNGVALPDDINLLIANVLIEAGCADCVERDIKHIQKNGLYGQFKIIPNKHPNVMYVFKYQSGMILTWDSIISLTRDSGQCETTVTHKNELIKIERRKKHAGQNTDTTDD